MSTSNVIFQYVVDRDTATCEVRLYLSDDKGIGVFAIRYPDTHGTLLDEDDALEYLQQLFAAALINTLHPVNQFLI